MSWTRSTVLVTLLATLALPATAQEPRRFTRTPYLSGPDDPEQGQVRGSFKLGETVVIEIPGGFDSILEPGGVPELSERRYSRRGGPFEIEEVEPGDWLAIHIINIESGPYATTTMAAPSGAACGGSRPSKTACCTFHRTS
jgi:hypothetical protein